MGVKGHSARTVQPYGYVSLVPGRHKLLSPDPVLQYVYSQLPLNHTHTHICITLNIQICTGIWTRESDASYKHIVRCIFVPDDSLLDCGGPVLLGTG